MRFLALAVGGDEDWSGLNPEEIDRAVQRYTDWAGKAAGSGNLVAGGSLDNDIRILTRSAGGAVASGTPNGDRHTQICGWTEVEAASLDEAAALFLDHPHLDYGTFEIRPVTDLG